MKRFLIKIKLSDGYQANIRVTAEDGDTAIKRIENQPEFINFIEGREILEIEFEEIPIIPVSPDNYLLQPSQGKFNDTQQNTILFDDATMNELEYATAMRELGEYMNQYHREIIS